MASIQRKQLSVKNGLLAQNVWQVYQNIENIAINEYDGWTNRIKALVVQRIGRKLAELVIGVRFLSRAQNIPKTPLVEFC